MAGGEKPLLAALVELPGTSPRLAVDTDRDGHFGSAEIHALDPAAPATRYAGEVIIRVPVSHGLAREFPIFVRLRKPDSTQESSSSPTPRIISYSFLALAGGTVELDGKAVRVWCGYNVQNGSADPARDTVGVDIDGDGILGAPPSPERANPLGEEIIFRKGGSFVSIHSIEFEKQRILVKTHAASEYQAIDLAPGTVVPDFEFTDFAGKPRRLSEFGGRFVLLDFWGTWCGPCVEELPNLKRAWNDFHHRGLEIIGIDCNEPSEAARKFAAENQLGWTQATAESTRNLVDRRFRIMGYPTHILLDGQRRILSTGQDEAKLSGDDLFRTLDRLLPAAPAAALAYSRSRRP